MKKAIISVLIFAATFSYGDNIKQEIQKEISIFNKEWTQNPEKCDIQNILPLFNLDYAGMEKIKAAAESEDWNTAEKELLAYFKKTRGDNYKPVKLHKNDQEFADKALVHEFRGNKTYPPVFRGVKIDWRSEAVLNGKTIHDREWLLQFNRLTWWRSLANVYAKTNKEDYFYEWRYELVDYMKTNLPLTRKTPWPIRRGMETYDRCLQHIAVLPSFIRSGNFDTKTLRYFLSSFHQQAEHIRTIYSKSGNHLVGELNAIYRCGLAFPEFKKALEWRNDALTRLPKLMFSEIYEDGMNKELIFSYHGMYVMLFSNFYKLLKKHNHEVQLPAEYIKRLKKACDIMMYQTFPDWTSSQFGDAWKGDGSNWFYRLYACTLFPKNPYYKFMKTRAKKRLRSSYNEYSLPYQRILFFPQQLD